MQLTSNEKSTARIALLAWIHRCKKEAALMLELANDYAPGSEQNLKCIKNAAASDGLKVEAEALLDKLRG